MSDNIIDEDEAANRESRSISRSASDKIYNSIVKI